MQKPISKTKHLLIILKDNTLYSINKYKTKIVQT